jgi:hypothetical protein
MLASTYDTNSDGTVNAADTATYAQDADSLGGSAASQYSTGSHYSDSDIGGDESAFTGWDKNKGDDTKVSFKNITSNYVLTLADTAKKLMVSSASTVVITVPLETTADFPDGTFLSFWREGAGDVIVKPASGVTLRSIFDDTATAGDSLRVQNSPYYLEKDDLADTWNGYGDAK